LSKGRTATPRVGKCTRPVRALAAGEQCTAPAAGKCKHLSAGTLHPYRNGIIPILYNASAHVTSKVPFPAWDLDPI